MPVLQPEEATPSYKINTNIDDTKVVQSVETVRSVMPDCCALPTSANITYDDAEERLEFMLSSIVTPASGDARRIRRVFTVNGDVLSSVVITPPNIAPCVTTNGVSRVLYSDLGERCPDKIRLDVYAEYLEDGEWQLCTRRSYLHSDYRIYNSETEVCHDPGYQEPSDCEPFC